MIKRLSVVMPVLNGENFIVDNVRKVYSILGGYVQEKLIKDYEIVVVDDGSVDATFSLLKENFSENSKIIITKNSFNQGKGFAIKQGVKYSSGDVIVIIDSDLDIPPEQIKKLIIEYQNGYDIVITSKFEKESKLKYPIYRKIISMIYYLIVKVLFRLPVKDTQTGLKLFKGEAIRYAVEKMVVKRFAFDLELLAIAYRHNYSIKSIPVVIDFKRKVGFVGIKVLLNTFIDTLGIFYRLKVMNYYDRPTVKVDDKIGNFYILKGETLEGVNCDSKKIDEVRDEDTIIISQYPVDLEVIKYLNAIHRDYLIDVINGVVTLSEETFAQLIRNNTIFSYLILPFFHLSSRFVQYKFIPIVVSDLISVKGKVLKKLMQRKTCFDDFYEIARGLNTVCNSFFLYSDWFAKNTHKFSIFDVFREYYQKTKLIIISGNYLPLLARGIFWFGIYISLLIGALLGNYYVLFFPTAFLASYLLIKFLLSGIKVFFYLPFFLLFSIKTALLGMISPIIYSIRKKS